MASKRSATAAGAPDIGSPSSKRRRVSADGDSSTESEKQATHVGLKFINQLKASKDKSGRDVAPAFLTLPDQRKYPDYYKVIKLPIAIQTVEDKLAQKAYPTISHVESDLKRMVKNAKDYNDKNSPIFADAERIRKMLSNFMVKHNPAYNDPNYVALPTPVEGEDQITNPGGSGGAMNPERPKSMGRASSRRQTPRSLNEGASPAANMDVSMTGDFNHDTFQTAQEKIVTELLDLQNDDGVITFSDFVNLPPRDLTDYYRLIKHPVSLKAIEKKVKGQEGRKEPTGASLFRSWDAFEEEMSFIWQNAYEFNEDRSTISVLASELEAQFKQRLAEAKQVVAEPSQGSGESSGPRIKLNMKKSPDPTQKLKIRFGGQRSDQRTSDESLVQVDSEALRRQRELVNAGANGKGVPVADTPSAHPGARNPFTGSTSSSGPNVLPTIGQPGDRNRSGSATSPALSASAIKSESILAQAPVLQQPRKDSRASDEANPSPTFPSAPHMPPPSGNSYSVQAQPQPPTWNWESDYRKPGKDATSALILRTTISTHPDIKVENHFSMDIFPDSIRSHYSVSMELPPTHYYLRVIPTLAQIGSDRQHKLVVKLRGNTLTAKGNEADPTRPIYDMRILPDCVNDITVDRLSVPARCTPNDSQNIELERVTVFVHITKD